MQLEEIQTVAVIGAGQMGRGIAQVCAAAGYSVRLADAERTLADSGKQRIEQQLAKQVDKQRLSASEAAQLLARIDPADVSAAAGGAQLLIEAVSEDAKLKSSLLSELDRLAPASSILASNTSSISITRLAACTARPGQVVGLHFMNPVPLMRLVELVQGLQSSDAALAVARQFAERLGKTVVQSQDRPGFIVNRILIPLINEACFALQENVASVRDIDQAIVLGLNHPMGPLRLADLIGLDTVLAIAEVLHGDFGDSKYRPAALLRCMVAGGYLGQKSGRGFYEYEGGRATGPSALPAVSG